MKKTNKTGRRKVLVTGACGNIGSYFAGQACSRYELSLLGHDDGSAAGLKKFGTVKCINLLDLDGMKKACEGMDTVLHLAANANPSATWSDLLNSNIIGTYNTFVAAKHAGCRRVIFASSIHAVSGYPPDVQVKTSDPVNPGDLYGVSKCFGEALGRYMAEKEGLSVIAIRIGAFTPREKACDAGAIPLLDAFVSRRDLHQLIVQCIEARDLQFAIFHAISNNRFKRLDISDAREKVGFNPEDDLTELNSMISPIHLASNVMHHSNKDSGQKSGLREELK